MMKHAATSLLVFLQVLVGGWAFLRTLEPDTVLAILRLVTFC
jgi:heme A synthase